MCISSEWPLAVNSGRKDRQMRNHVSAIRWRTIVLLFVVFLVTGSLAGTPDWNQPLPMSLVDSLRVATGDDFIRACWEMRAGMHTRPAGFFTRVNDALLDRLPTLGGRERRFCLLALERTADREGRALSALKEMWNEARDEDTKRQLFRPLIVAMGRAQRYELAEEIFEYATRSDMSDYTDDFGILGFLVDVEIRESTRMAFAKHLRQQMREGIVGALSLPSALRLARDLNPDDPGLLQITRALSGHSQTQISAVLREMLTSAPTRGGVNMCVLLMSDTNPEVRRQARQTHAALVKALADMARDAVYLEDIRMVFDPGHPLSFDRYGRLGHRYFREEADIDLDGLIRRLQWAGVTFSKREQEFFRGMGLPEKLIGTLARKDTPAR